MKQQYKEYLHVNCTTVDKTKVTISPLHIIVGTQMQKKPQKTSWLYCRDNA